jgi:hypothetical protein
MLLSAMQQYLEKEVVMVGNLPEDAQADFTADLKRF